jgi:hypothetical protein
MPPVGFKPTISVLERAKTVCALDRAATAIGVEGNNTHILLKTRFVFRKFQQFMHTNIALFLVHLRYFVPNRRYDFQNIQLKESDRKESSYWLQMA